MQLATIGKEIRHRREDVGLSQDRLAKLAHLSRQTILKLESGTIKDLSFQRVMSVLAVLGLDLDPPTLALRKKKRGLWMAAKNASVSYRGEFTEAILENVLASGLVPSEFVAHITHFLDETPIGLVVMAIEETALQEHRPAAEIWRNVSTLARSYSHASDRKNLWK